VHRAPWPDAAALRAVAGPADPLVLEVTAAALTEVRKAKTTAKRSLRTEVVRVVVTDTPARIAALRLAAGDLREAGRIATLELVEVGPTTAPSVEVALAEPDAPAGP
jgi:valyl-tRNA synthetase